MRIQNLLSKGYFSEELPPPFVSEQLGKSNGKVKKIIDKLSSSEKKQILNSDFVLYSIPKVGLHRRLNGIPNPYHQFKLSQAICDNWLDILNKYKKSKISASIPEIDCTGKRAIIQFAKFDKFKEKCLKDSFDTFYELRTDISKYFPSIYTHSIPWAIHTKQFSKLNRGNSHYGNLIDECIRNTQNGQTNGIVIGTDTSRIIAELIGCYIDEQLLTVLRKEKIEMKGYRFVDDCHFFFYNRSDAERALKFFQSVLGGLNLNINEEKTKIEQSPFLFDSNWQIQLNSLNIREASIPQRNDLRSFYNLLIDLSKKNANDSVIKYGIKIFKRLQINELNWDLFESLTYSLAIAEGAILPDVLEILLQNETKIDKKKLASTLNSLLKQHIYKGHNFEVAWCLWIAKSFSIKIDRVLAQQIIDSSDIISIMILLDLRNSKLINGRLITKNLLLEFDANGLINNKWLLVYEATLKKWVKSNCLSSIKFFEELSKLKVSFYDSSKQIDFGNSNIIDIKTSKQKSKATTKSKKILEFAKIGYVG